uniref:Uncharacterized protein n=1 Tax=Rhizophora mucronata TaxID=61149 RepID=A0A2P2J469_RHIMU
MRLTVNLECCLSLKNMTFVNINLNYDKC